MNAADSSFCTPLAMAIQQSRRRALRLALQKQRNRFVPIHATRLRLARNPWRELVASTAAGLWRRRGEDVAPCAARHALAPGTRQIVADFFALSRGLNLGDACSTQSRRKW
jgi:hypothetical protein